MKKLGLLVLSLMVNITVNANGNRLMESCSEYIKNEAGSGYEIGQDPGSYIGYIEGALDTVHGYKINNICMPERITVGQAVSVVYEFLQNHSERLHEHKFFLVKDAFKEAWSCNKE